MRRECLIFLVAALLAASGAAAEGKVYKCRNIQGKLIYQQTPCMRDVQPISSWDAKPAPVQQEVETGKMSGSSYVIRQRNNGHYFLDGKINGKPLTFVVDTGASSVSLPRSIAFIARISCKEQIKMQTANGSTGACLAVISTLNFGPFVLKNVQATIVPNLDQPLMGMNVLQQFRIEQDNGEMRISARN